MGLEPQSLVVSGRLYGIALAPTTGTQPRTFYVLGLQEELFDAEGTLEEAGQRTRGSLDLATGTFTPRPAGGVALGTGTVLHFTQDAEYPNLSNTTFTVDATGAVAGVVVGVRLEASASQPTLPAGFVKLAGSYVQGQRHKYTFCVAPDGTIEYLISPLP